MKMRSFESELWLPLPPSDVFPFFGDAANLEAITPTWLHFKTLTPAPIEMKAGTLIDYQIRVHGFPCKWRTRISVWEPPYRFVDEQIRGPYRQWIHEHQFEAKRGGTLVRDSVRYAVPFDFLIHAWLVRPDIEQIFLYRSTALQKRFLK